MADKEAHVVDCLTSFVDNINLVTTQIRHGEERDVEDFTPQSFWQKAEMVYKALSHEVTKLSLSFSSKPLPNKEACESLLAGVEKVTLGLVSIYYGLPTSQGCCLKKALRNSVLNITEDIKTLAEIIKQGDSGSSEQLQSTGVVWSHTEDFTSLPKNNRDAAVTIIQECSDLVKDALEEMKESLESSDGDIADVFEKFDSEDHPKWTEEEKTLIGHCLGLIKVTKSLLKKTKETVKSQGKCDSQTNISQLDSLVDLVKDFSPAIDELSSNIYPPMEYSDILENSDSLYILNGTVISFVRESHVSTEDDQTWIEFLLKANQHNMDKITKYAEKVS